MSAARWTIARCDRAVDALIALYAPIWGPKAVYFAKSAVGLTGSSLASLAAAAIAVIGAYRLTLSLCARSGRRAGVAAGWF